VRTGIVYTAANACTLQQRTAGGLLRVYRQWYAAENYIADRYRLRAGSLTLSGLPPHKLNIKLGAPVMLLRNMDPSRGHCNGTRYIVRQISRRYITAEIACSEYAGNDLLIPRIPLSPTDAGLPFTLRRRQFPLRPAFAITINKAQGQTLQCVGVLLDEPVFTHGQLYFASSRCGDPSRIRFYVQNRQTVNVVYKEVLSNAN